MQCHLLAMVLAVTFHSCSESARALLTLLIIVSFFTLYNTVCLNQ